MEKLSLIVLSFIVSLLFQNLSAVDAQNFLSILSECKTAENATDMDFVNLRMEVKPRTRVVKCLMACVTEKFGKMKDNKLNPEVVLKAVKSSPRFAEKSLKAVTEVIEECKSIRDPDRCELASKLMDCFKNGAVKRGMKPDTFITH